jgi:hypothetical protein
MGGLEVDGDGYQRRGLGIEPHRFGAIGSPWVAYDRKISAARPDESDGAARAWGTSPAVRSPS